MKEQTNGNNPCFFKEKHHHIRHHCPISMQKMKIDATTIRVENRRSKKVVQIDQHCRNQDQPNFFPFRFVKYISNQPRNQKVETIMKNRSCYFDQIRTIHLGNVSW